MSLHGGHSARTGMPRAYEYLSSMLFGLVLPQETRANCSSCVMMPPEGKSVDDGVYFHPKARCCTYHPSLPNFLAGRILQRGGKGGELLSARLSTGDGLYPLGVKRTDHPDMLEYFRREKSFGTNPVNRCPFWVGGDLACGIWLDRDAVCRTWFCRHESGMRGTVMWIHTRNLIWWLETRLSQWCVSIGNPPSPVGEVRPSTSEWEDWYVECAVQLDKADPLEFEGLRDKRMTDLEDQIAAAHSRLDGPMPDFMEPSVARVVEADDEGYAVLVGKQTFDPVLAPRGVFKLLSLLDGSTNWREALAFAKAEAPELDETFVRRLYQAGVIDEPDSEEPDMSIEEFMERLTDDDDDDD